MTRHFFTFLGTFVLGAIVALAARTVVYRPNPADSAPAPAATSAPDPHAQHQAASSTPATAPAAASDAPVNTVCAICGMDVDPKSPTAEYKGRKIGFGCRMCLPKFKADPDKYGPYYLRNEVIKR